MVIIMSDLVYCVYNLGTFKNMIKEIKRVKRLYPIEKYEYKIEMRKCFCSIKVYNRKDI